MKQKFKMNTKTLVYALVLCLTIVGFLITPEIGGMGAVSIATLIPIWGSIKDNTFKELTVDEKMEEIKVMLKTQKSINFYDLFKKEITRNELIVSFWSILEMVKMSIIIIRQHSVFGDIFIFKISKNEKNKNELTTKEI